MMGRTIGLAMLGCLAGLAAAHPARAQDGGPGLLGPLFGEGAPPAARPANEQFNCLSLGANGRTLPNPNVAFICGQIDALRSDCELLRIASDAPVMNVTHCLNWRRSDVRPGVGGTGNPAARAQSTGGGGR